MNSYQIKKLAIVLMGVTAAISPVTTAHALTDVGLQEYQQKSQKEQMAFVQKMVVAKYPKASDRLTNNLLNNAYECISLNATSFAPFFVLKDVCVDLAGK